MKQLKLTIALLALMSLSLKAQVGFNCQFVPGLQVGSVKVKTDNTYLKDYKFGAPLPVFMVDRITSKWYTNMDMSALYYAATQYNNATAGKIDIAKTEGGYFAGRLGYGFGKGENFRVGPNLNAGWSASNLDSSKRVLNVPSYFSLGGGVFAYYKVNKRIRVSLKAGYEKYSNKSANNNVKNLSGHGTYIEGAVAYNFYQKYGLAIMPAIISKKFQYTYTGATLPNTAKVHSAVLRLGFTKFF